MQIRHRTPRRRSARWPWLLAVAGLVAAGVVAALVLRGGPPITGGAAAVGAPAASVAPDAAGQAAPAVPTEVEIPAIGARSRLVDLVQDAGLELQAPEDPAIAGWFAAGVVPGEPGPAVIGGHVDSTTGPGVFAELPELDAGDKVLVHRSDGGTVTFRVVSVTAFPKTGFPTAQVYGPTPGPELRLVTCGGTFDRGIGRYRDNVIVEAVLA